uniref:Uncharacterized protein n=1 Tax=Meloidogyne enterolobii TaxID=390850 RepID=A0A6V7WZA8_MELEN|nr:unnamed protein product [Meloidogyne enterolobii]
MILFFIFIISKFSFIHSKGTVINLYEQPGTLRRGPGDIANLWLGGLIVGGFLGEYFEN